MTVYGSRLKKVLAFNISSVWSTKEGVLMIQKKKRKEVSKLRQKHDVHVYIFKLAWISLLRSPLPLDVYKEVNHENNFLHLWIYIVF